MPAKRKPPATARKRTRKPPHDRLRCIATKTRGGRCKNAKVKGTEYCVRHGPEGEANARKGGEEQRRQWEEINALAEAFPVGSLPGQKKHLVAIIARLERFQGLPEAVELQLKAHKVLAAINKLELDQDRSDRPVTVTFAAGGKLGV